jgi:predicted alpha/beta superfamily hydrolase
MLKLQLIVILAISTLASIALAQGTKTSNSTLPTVQIPNTQQLTLTSSVVANQEYVLHVNLPSNYKDSTKTFPVIYLLDSQWDFPLLSAIFGEQYYDGFVPGAIVVGITWGGQNPNYDALRARDLTPTSPDKSTNFGNAKNFLSFIKTELTPFIKAKYRASDERTLVGSSFGGLFTLYAMFTETAFFKNYVLTSPAVQWDNELIYNIEKEYSNKNKQLPVRLFMAVGALEEVSVFQKWEATLKSRNYSGLQLQTKVLENIGHSGTKAEGYTRGIQWAFKRAAISLSPAQLNSYVGTYVVENQTFRMEIEKDALVAVIGNEKLKLSAQTSQDFYYPGTFFNLHFVKEKDKVTGFQIESYRGGGFAKKTE